MTRIIAGARKGHRLRTPAHSATRPTSDRVREAAFSAIADWAGSGGQPATEMLAGLSFIDLYAGSAAVALEAASRGAGPVYAVESAGDVVAIARGNAAAARLAVTVIAAPVEKWLRGPAPLLFDVIWADPPYAVTNDQLRVVLDDVERWLAPRGLLVLERSSRDDVPRFPNSLTQTWQRRYGETTLYFTMKDEMC